VGTLAGAPASEDRTSEPEDPCSTTDMPWKAATDLLRPAIRGALRGNQKLGDTIARPRSSHFFYEHNVGPKSFNHSLELNVFAQCRTQKLLKIMLTYVVTMLASVHFISHGGPKGYLACGTFHVVKLALLSVHFAKCTDDGAQMTT